MAVKHCPCLLTVKKGPRFLKPSAWENFSASLIRRTRPTTWVQIKINFLLCPQEPLLAAVKRQKLAWFGHVIHHDSLSKTILQGTLESGWCCGWERKCWMDNIKEWTSLPMPELLTRASCRKDCKSISTESSLMSPPPPPPQRPNWSRDWTVNS